MSAVISHGGRGWWRGGGRGWWGGGGRGWHGIQIGRGEPAIFEQGGAWQGGRRLDRVRVRVGVGVGVGVGVRVRVRVSGRRLASRMGGRGNGVPSHAFCRVRLRGRARGRARVRARARLKVGARVKARRDVYTYSTDRCMHMYA